MFPDALAATMSRIDARILKISDDDCDRGVTPPWEQASAGTLAKASHYSAMLSSPTTFPLAPLSGSSTLLYLASDFIRFMRPTTRAAQPLRIVQWISAVAGYEEVARAGRANPLL